MNTLSCNHVTGIGDLAKPEDVSAFSISCNSRSICVPLKPETVSARTHQATSKFCELNDGEEVP